MSDTDRATSGFDQPVTASEYIEEATKEYFGDAGVIEAKDWTQAAAGLITLIVLGAIILSQVLGVSPGGGAH